MGKNKLKKFAEMEDIPFVFQYPWSRLKEEPFSLRGHWGADFFGNSNPIVVELGCGKGEYTVGLARRDPGKNYIGIDIKGSRMHAGATTAMRLGLHNVAFVRTSIELLEAFFAPGEISQIWITFPDPQMQKCRKRLTSTRFMQLYRNVLGPGGVIHLKTDSNFLYTYTRLLALANERAITLLSDTDDLYAGGPAPQGTHLDIRTHYEQQWLDRGLTIKYLCMRLDGDAPLSEITDDDIPRDTYRSYSRGYIQMPQLMHRSDNL